jgi:hypothetical protein
MFCKMAGIAANEIALSNSRAFYRLQLKMLQCFIGILSIEKCPSSNSQRDL